MHAIPSLTVGEDAHERGLHHGRAFAGQVIDNIATYVRRFAASGLCEAEAFAEARRWQKAMAAQNEDYVAEMRGIAAGAGVEESAVALLNARYEIAFSLFGRDAARQGDPARKDAPAMEGAGETDGCTTFGLLPEATSDGHTWLGQNWDWLAGIHGRTLVLRIRRQRRPSLVCLTEAGIVGGKMGVNECGIGLVENGLASSHDGRNPYARPFHMRCREVLDAERFEDALRPVVAERRSCSANYLIGAAGVRGTDDDEDEVIDLETSPDHVTALHPERGIITHSNHFVGAPGADGHGQSLIERIGPNTLYRSARLRRALMRRRGTLDRATLETVMSDHFGAPSAICRHADAAQPEAKRTMTVGAVLIDLDARILQVADGPPCSNPYIAFPVEIGPRSVERI